VARPSKPWYWSQRDLWCCTVAGQRHVLAEGKANKRVALEEFHRLMASLGRRGAAPPQRATFAELADLFLEDVCRAVERGERAAITYEGYVRFLSSAAERMGAQRVADLTPHAVLAWCEAPALKWGPTTRANALTAVKAMTRWARRRGLLREDPLVDLKKPTRRKREAVLTDDQVRAVLGATEGTPFADLIFGLWESGCRPNELVTLTADRVDVERGTWLVVNKTRTSTGQQHRAIFLTPALVELSRRLLERHPEGLVFRNARGRAWTRNAQACAWRRLRGKLGMGPEATSYAIRHRYGIEGLRRGLDSSELAALMGHTNPKMVDQVYGHWDQQADRLREAALRVRPGQAGPDPDPRPGGGRGSPDPSGGS
jgi:integrase